MKSEQMTIRHRVQRGFSLISAIFLLVVIAALGAFAVTLSTAQHQSAAMDVRGARAYQAARAGIEWAAFGITNTAVGAVWAGCAAPAPPALGGTLAPFAVVVACVSAPYTEGTTVGTVYILTSTATAGGAPGNLDYIERVITVTLTR